MYAEMMRTAMAGYMVAEHSMLGTTRTHVVEARAAAGSDVDARLRVLDGYTEYMRSLETIVYDIQVMP